MRFIATACARHTYQGQWYSVEQFPAVEFEAASLKEAKRFANEWFVYASAHLENPLLYVDVQAI